MSRRVMEMPSAFTPDLEIYSIDEAFLGMDGFGARLGWLGLQLIQELIVDGRESGAPASFDHLVGAGEDRRRPSIGLVPENQVRTGLPAGGQRRVRGAPSSRRVPIGLPAILAMLTAT
jgi:hypothetical protein